MTESKLIQSETFLIDKENPLNNEIKKEIESLVESISSEFPKCSIILGGSLCYAEGKTIEKNRKSEVSSDVDIFLVFDSLWQSISARKNHLLAQLKSRINVIRDIEFIIVWDKALKFHLTTLAGKTLKKENGLDRTLDKMKTPEPVNNLKRAYKFLIKGISEGDSGMPYFEKSAIQAFQAFLFFKENNASYGEWKNFYSLKKCSEKALEYEREISSEFSRFLRDAIASRFEGDYAGHYPISEAKETTEKFLDLLSGKINRGFKVNDYIRYVSYNLKTRKRANLAVNSTSLFFETAEEILKNCVKGGDEMKRASKLLRKLTGKSIPEEMSLSEKIKTSAHILMEYDKSYLHKA